MVKQTIFVKTVRAGDEPTGMVRQTKMNGTLIQVVRTYTDEEAERIFRKRQPIERVTMTGVVDNLVDGMTKEQCFEIFQANQREGTPRPLTSNQMAAARDMWSAMLKTAMLKAAEESKAHEISVVMELDCE